jgi:hypothetical protein
MGINSVLHHYIPQHSPQIWDEPSKTKTNFSILRNTRLWVFDFSLVNDHAPLPCFSKPGSAFLKQQGDLPSSRRQGKTLVLFSELAYSNRIVDYWLLLHTGKKVCAKPYMDLSVFINSYFAQNRIYDSLLQQKHAMSLLRGLRVGVDQFSHL